MRKKIAWLMLSCLMAVSLVLASCAPAPVEEEEGYEIVTPGEEVEEVVAPEEEVVEEVVAPEEEVIEGKMVAGRFMEKPKYGGTFHFSWGDPQGWDWAFMNSWRCTQMTITNEKIFHPSWETGPSGTNEFPMKFFMKGSTEVRFWSESDLMESWEYAEDDITTMIWHLKQGVRFHPKPPVYGREMTADDVVYSFMRGLEMWGNDYDMLMEGGLEELAGLSEEEVEALEAQGLDLSKGTWLAKNPWPEEKTDPTIKRVFWGSLFYIYTDDVEALDKYTVRFATDRWNYQIRWYIGMPIVPREACELEFSEEGYAIGLKDWRNANGTNAFMLTDYVPGSGASYVRHPNYHLMDAFFPDQRLPYADGIELIILPDTATWLASLATGKIDQASYIWWPDRQTLLATAPQLKWFPQTTAPVRMAPRCDIPPFDNRWVRKALSMGLDRYKILEDFYHGEGTIFDCPIPHWSTTAYTPIEELPEDIAEGILYNPDKAIELLTEQGMPQPDALKFTLQIESGYADHAAMVKRFWEDIGVETEVEVVESAAYWTTVFDKTYEHMMMWSYDAEFPESTANHYIWPGTYNFQAWDSDYFNEQYQRIATIVDDVERALEFKDLFLYVLDHNPRIWWPGGQKWVVAQPWVKRYSGELSKGWENFWGPFNYAWIDQDLKYELTGMRE